MTKGRTVPQQRKVHKPVLTRIPSEDPDEHAGRQYLEAISTVAYGEGEQRWPAEVLGLQRLVTALLARLPSRQRSAIEGSLRLWAIFERMPEKKLEDQQRLERTRERTIAMVSNRHLSRKKHDRGTLWVQRWYLQQWLPPPGAKDPQSWLGERGPHLLAELALFPCTGLCAYPKLTLDHREQLTGKLLQIFDDQMMKGTKTSEALWLSVLACLHHVSPAVIRKSLSHPSS